jgi:hypothetical protein
MWGGWKKGYISKYVRGHNAKVDSVYFDAARQKEFANKRKAGFESGKYRIWNEGLTKESDERLLRASQKKSVTLKSGYEKGRIPWQKLDTLDARLSLEKMSATKKQLFASGELKSWNAGLTKETSPSLARAAQKISQKYILDREMGKRMSQTEFFERVQIACSSSFSMLDDVDKHYRYKHDRFRLKCLTCQNVVLKTLYMLETTPICFFCHPKESRQQLEIFDIVKSVCPDAILSDRSAIAPLELDIFVPSKNIAIEFNGLYWHSEIFKDKLYHEKKMQACRQAGIKLLSIYEDEWRDKRDLIISMIEHRLCGSSSKFDARKLKIVSVDSKRRKDFFETNHLEGDALAQHAFGLETDKGELLACVSLRRAFHKRWANWYELGRSSCKIGYNVRGWLGRLTAAAYVRCQNDGKRLMTYVDGRVGAGDAYIKAGWKLLKSSTGPRFWWTDFENRFNRFKYRADKANGKVQSQVAEEAGVVPIYGCSNSIFVYEGK